MMMVLREEAGQDSPKTNARQQWTKLFAVRYDTTRIILLYGNEAILNDKRKRVSKELKQKRFFVKEISKPLI